MAQLPELIELKNKYQARIFVDDAHGTGTLGRSGRGTAEHLGVDDGIDVYMGTLGKSLGSFGAYVAGSRRLVDMLVNRARSFVFTTGLPPSAVAAAQAAVEICRREPELGLGLRQRVAALAERLRSEGLQVPAAESQILPIGIGEAAPTMAAMQALLARDVYVAAIRPPTVPPGTSRLRLSVMASHSEAELEIAAKALVDAVGEAVKGG